MDQRTFSAVDEYVAGLLTPHDEALEAAIDATAAAGIPAIQVSTAQAGSFTCWRGRSVLEFGTLGGYSAIWLGRALPDGGRLVTHEASARHAEVARGNLTRRGSAGST